MLAVCHKLGSARRHSNLAQFHSSLAVTRSWSKQSTKRRASWKRPASNNCATKLRKKQLVSLYRLSRLCVCACVCGWVSGWGSEGGTNQWQQLAFDWAGNQCGWWGGAERIAQEGSQASRSYLDDSNWVWNIFLMTNRKRIVSVRRRWVPLHSTHMHPCPMRGGGETVDVLLTAVIELSEPAERTSRDWSGRIHPSGFLLCFICNRI